MPSAALFVLILAGGSGERFWPLSRKSRPKQLLSLFGRQTLLESTLRRLDGLVPPENILILTNALQRGSVTVVTAAMFGVETVVPAVIGLAFLHDRARSGLWPVAAAGFLLSVGGSVALALRTPAEVEVTASA